MKKIVAVVLLALLASSLIPATFVWAKEDGGGVTGATFSVPGPAGPLTAAGRSADFVLKGVVRHGFKRGERLSATFNDLGVSAAITSDDAGYYLVVSGCPTFSGDSPDGAISLYQPKARVRIESSDGSITKAPFTGRENKPSWFPYVTLPTPPSQSSIPGEGLVQLNEIVSRQGNAAKNWFENLVRPLWGKRAVSGAAAAAKTSIQARGPPTYFAFQAATDVHGAYNVRVGCKYTDYNIFSLGRDYDWAAEAFTIGVLNFMPKKDIYELVTKSGGPIKQAGDRVTFNVPKNGCLDPVGVDWFEIHRGEPSGPIEKRLTLPLGGAIASWDGTAANGEASPNGQYYVTYFCQSGLLAGEAEPLNTFNQMVVTVRRPLPEVPETPMPLSARAELDSVGVNLVANKLWGDLGQFRRGDLVLQYFVRPSSARTGSQTIPEFRIAPVLPFRLDYRSPCTSPCDVLVYKYVVDTSSAVVGNYDAEFRASVSTPAQTALSNFARHNFEILPSGAIGLTIGAYQNSVWVTSDAELAAPETHRLELWADRVGTQQSFRLFDGTVTVINGPNTLTRADLSGLRNGEYIFMVTLSEQGGARQLASAEKRFTKGAGAEAAITNLVVNPPSGVVITNREISVVIENYGSASKEYKAIIKSVYYDSYLGRFAEFQEGSKTVLAEPGANTVTFRDVQLYPGTTKVAAEITRQSNQNERARGAGQEIVINRREISGVSATETTDSGRGRVILTCGEQRGIVCLESQDCYGFGSTQPTGFVSASDTTRCCYGVCRQRITQTIQSNIPEPFSDVQTRTATSTIGTKTGTRTGTFYTGRAILGFVLGIFNL